MKRIYTIAIASVLALLFACRAQAQGSRHDGVVQGEQGIPVAGATIVVCTQPANVTVTPCTPLANLYTDTTLTTPSANPLTSDGLGNFHFYAAPGLYTVQVYGPGINTYTTPDVLLPTNPSNAQFSSITATNAISALTLSLGGNLAVGGNASIIGTLTAGSLAANLAATSNAQLKGSGVILYADTTASGCGGSGCSDSNDGKSLGSAMATIDHALCSLPAGNCSTQIAGNGTVYFVDGSSANSTSTCGVWLMGILDPNYSSPPPCWLRVVNGTGGIALIGIPKASYGPNTQIPRAAIVGGSSADRNHPGIWLSGTNEAIYIANAAVQYPGRGIVVGECSNNVRTGCPVAGVYFDNDTANLNSASGNGPAWDITGASFWIRLRNCGGSGLDSVNTNTSDDAAAVLVDGRTNSGVGLVFIDDFNASNGGIKFYSGANGGSLNVSKLTTEAQNGEPAVWFASTGSGSDYYVVGTVNKVAVADALATTPGVEVDIPGYGILANDVEGQGVNLVGPMHTAVQYTNNLQNQTVSPQRYGQTGTVQGWNYGKRDDVQRGAGLTTVRFANQTAGSACSSWTTSQFAGTSTKTCTGIADPFGGTNAGQAASNNSAVEQLNFTSGSGGVENVSLSVGEYIIAGVWTRSQTANGYSGNPYVGAALSVNGTGFSASGGCDGDSVLGDGQWTWNRCIYKVTAVGTNPAAVEFGTLFNSTYTVQAYAPVLNFIPAGTFSDNEAFAYENALKTYDSLCAVGASCGMEFNPIQAPAFETETANPAQSGIFRLSDGDAITWRNHANTADVSLSKNTSDQLIAPPFASPTFLSPIVDSTSGASGVTFRNSGSTVWTANASSSALSFNFNAHLGETTLKLSPFGGQSYAGLLDNYGMAAGFVAVTESSGSMAFDAGLGNTFEVTLNANVSSTNLVNAQAGQWLHFIICQPSSGGPFTFNWPGTVRGGMTIGTTAGKCNAQSFVFDGASAFATSPGVANQ
ncbi:MAG: carboxypeptidase-like regulatory domain-containing protein [Candidatus Acidiferrales bacterium]